MTFVNVRVALSQPGRKTPSNRMRIAVYALFDDSDGGVRYVGMTRGPLARRLEWHQKAPTNYAMARWLASARVRIVALEYVTESEWEEAERGWIYWHRQRGDLLNVDPGGAYRDAAGAPRPLTIGTFVEPTASGRGRHKTGPGKYWHLANRPMTWAEHRSANESPSGRRRTRID